MSVYKDLIISTIVDINKGFVHITYVYKDLIISTIVDLVVTIRLLLTRL